MWMRLLRRFFAIRSFPRAGSRRLRRRHRHGVEALENRFALSLDSLQLFPADNPWNQNISNAPLATNSAAVIANIGAATSVHPDWGADNPANGTAPLYGIPVNIVHANGMSTVNVVIDNYPGESDIVPVPIPANAVVEGDYQNGPNPNGGGDRANQRGDSHLIIWDEDHNVAYELYGVTRPTDPKLFPDNNDVEKTKTDTAWHAAQETFWDMKTDTFRTLGATSADAAGLSILAGLARPDEGLTVAEGGQGAINHALRLTLPKSVVNPQYIYPASHMVNDTLAADKLPFGARLRLANTTAVNMLISHMPPESQIVARAMQQYGLIVADIGSAMYVTGASATVDNVDTPNSKLTWNLDDIFASNGLKTLNAGDFEVMDLTPRVTRLSATSGLPGSTITITGQNFSGAAGHLSVLFGGVPATSFNVLSDSQISVVVPSGSGTVDVTVQSGVAKNDNISSNPNANVTKPIFGYGTSATSSADQFTYAAGSTTLTWNGTPNGNWTAPDWTGASLSYPDNTANAIIHTTSVVQVTSSQAAYSLAISGGGQVTVASAAGLAVTTNTSVTAGGTLNVSATGTFSTGGTLTLDTGGSLVGGNVNAASFQLNDGTVSAKLSGPGGLTKNTNGTVTLSGKNTYAGATTVVSGTLVVVGGALPAGTSLIIGGTSGAPSLVTIAATDSSGNPLNAAALSSTSAISTPGSGPIETTTVNASSSIPASVTAAVMPTVTPTAAVLGPQHHARDKIDSTIALIAAELIGNAAVMLPRAACDMTDSTNQIPQSNKTLCSFNASSFEAPLSPTSAIRHASTESICDARIRDAGLESEKRLSAAASWLTTIGDSSNDLRPDEAFDFVHEVLATLRGDSVRSSFL